MTERITAGRCGGPLGRRFELGDTLSAPAAVKIIYLFFIFFVLFMGLCSFSGKQLQHHFDLMSKK